VVADHAIAAFLGTQAFTPLTTLFAPGSGDLLGMAPEARVGRAGSTNPALTAPQPGAEDQPAATTQPDGEQPVVPRRTAPHPDVSPQESGLLTDVLSSDVVGLGRGVQGFLTRIEHLAGELAQSRARLALLLPLLAALGGAYGVVRHSRSRRRAAHAATSAALEQDTDTYSPFRGPAGSAGG